MNKVILPFLMLFLVYSNNTINAQNVGIGTSVPTEKLHVQGNVRITALGGVGNALVLTNNTGVLSRTALSGNPTDVLNGNGAFVSIASLNDDDWTVAGVNMYNNNTGNVGIGTTTPIAKLDVTGGRVEFTATTDATGTTGSGVLEIGNSLRLDGNEIITNTSSPFYINSDNNGDVQMDGGTFHLDASVNRIGIGITNPAYTVQTLVDGTISVNDGYIRQVRALYLQDWDDDTGGVDDTYRLLGRDGAWMFYNGGVVVGNYNNGTWADLADGYLIVENRVGVATTAPTASMDINGTFRLRGNGATAGDVLMSVDGNGNATWAQSGYGMVPIGAIVAWHGNMAGVPGLPAGWMECNGQGIADINSPLNGQTLPNLNGSTTSDAGNVSRGRFLRGFTTSGLYETDQSNNLDWINHDDSGSGDTDDYLADEGGVVTIRNYSTDGDRFQANLDGVETRVTNMSVRWIMRVK